MIGELHNVTLDKEAKAELGRQQAEIEKLRRQVVELRLLVAALHPEVFGSAAPPASRAQP